MYIEVLNEKRLKVELLLEDMQKLNIDRNSFLIKDINAKRALKSILKDAYMQTGFDIFNAQLTVEIFPTIDDGCLIIFTRKMPRRFKATAIKERCVFAFSSIDNLLDCLKIILHKESLMQSVVYRLKSTYYLVLDNRLRFDKSIMLVIDEFSNGKSNILKSYLDEHAELIFKKI